MTFGNSDLMRVGDWVMAMGNPLGQGFSVSAGIVSARNRELSGTYDDFIQTDAAINRGNSGGPLFNMDGQVIGVNTAILSPNGGSIGIGFSMASNVVTKVVDAAAGIRRNPARLAGRAHSGRDAGRGRGDGSGRRQGRAGHRCAGWSGQGCRHAGGRRDHHRSTAQPVADARDLIRRVADAPVGEAVPVVVLRDGKTETLQVTLGRREEAEARAGARRADPPRRKRRKRRSCWA